MKKKPLYLVPILFTLYLLLLVWIILFKLQFSLGDVDPARSVNLVPFAYDGGVTLRAHIIEMLQNFALFIPFGVYLCMFRREPKLWVKLLLPFAASLLLEVAQYVFSAGRSDVTDLIMNGCGGALGLLVHAAAVRLFRGRERADAVITALAASATVFVTGGLLFLIAVN